jgi:hypothetical protein
VKKSVMLAAVGIGVCLLGAEALARGAGGGGGGGRGGGGFSGGARPSAGAAISHSPSMSRAAPAGAVARPGTAGPGTYQPRSATQPAVRPSQPQTGNVRNVAAVGAANNVAARPPRATTLPAAPARAGGYWTPQWHAAHPGAWVAAGVGTAAWWTRASWNSAYANCGCSSEPTTYDYGNTVVYQDGNVCYGGQPVASAEQYYQQAAEIAAAGAQTENEEWMPLGVFGVIAAGQTNPDKLIQLAVNNAGVIRGNLEDTLADTVVQLQGAVDKRSRHNYLYKFYRRGDSV